MRTKKGFIMVYTIFVGIICLLIMMHIFNLQVSELKYSVSAKKSILKVDNYQKYKEYLMTLFYSHIDKNNNDIKTKGIKEFFCNGNSVVVSYGGGNVTYKKDNEFVFEIPYGSLVLRNDYFRLETINESLKLVFIKTEYRNK
jgi:hypothetical protein